MIPKIIHRAYFPTWHPGPLARTCWDSWSRHLPDYQVMEWTKDNLPQRQWIRDSVQAGYANLFSYMRYYALAKHGGVFLDNDVEILRPFDLDCGAFCGFQRADTLESCINVAVLASEPGHWVPTELLAKSEAMNPISHPLEFGPSLITQHLLDCGLGQLNREQTLDTLKVWPTWAFYPWRWDESPDRSRITDKTFTIHWWEGSWLKPNP